MRILKWAGLGVGMLIGLFLVTIVLVVLFVDPNDYKDDIERLVEQQTGRQLTLDGDLKLSVFPWLALEFGPASLSDAPGFGDEPFVALQHARLSVRLWPLLGGRVEIGSVTLEGMNVRLVTDADGRNNWADLTASAPDDAPRADAEPLSVPTIAGLEIRDSAISLEDRRDNSRIGVRELKLETDALASGKPFDLKSSFLLEASPELSARTEIAARVTPDVEHNLYTLVKPVITATLLGAGFPQTGQPLALHAASATLDVGHEQHTLDELLLETSWHGEGLPEAGVPVTLKASELKADLAAQTLALLGLEVDAAGAKVNGTLAGEEILDAPKFTGQLAFAPIELREWLPKLGVELPVTRDPKAFASLAFTAKVALTPSSAEFADLVLKLDDTTAKGTLGVADFDSQAVRFNLAVDRIDADRYLAPEEEAKNAAETQMSETIEIPVEMLRQLNVRGTLELGEAIFAGIKFTRLKLGVSARDGDVRFNPAEASLYGGQYRGDVGIAAASDVARITVDQQLSNVDFAPLFRDVFDTNRLSGKGSFKSKLAASGRDTDALLKSLDGTLDFGVKDGALEGADLWYEIRRARAVLRQQAIPVRTGPEHTAFTVLEGSGTVQNGVVQSNDITIAMQYMRVAGKATIDLPKSEIDSRLDATVLRIPAEGVDTAGMQELVNAKVPIRITGPLASPKVLPDVEGYLKNEVKQRLEKEKDKVEEKLRDRLQDRLRKALGGG